MATFLALKTALQNLLAQIDATVKRKPDRATTSDDAGTLMSVSKATLMSESQTKANTHINSKSNPHGITAVALGGVAKSYVDSDLATRIPMSSLSISQFGDTGSGSLGITYSAFTLQFTQVIQSFLMGIYRLIPAKNITLNEIDPSPANKTFYVYLRVSDGTIDYLVSTDLLAESLTTMYIGKVICGASAITSLVGFSRIARLGIYRISHSPIGSSIAVTDGIPVNTRKLNAGWQP